MKKWYETTRKAVIGDIVPHGLHTGKIFIYKNNELIFSGKGVLRCGSDRIKCSGEEIIGLFKNTDGVKTISISAVDFVREKYQYVYIPVESHYGFLMGDCFISSEFTITCDTEKMKICEFDVIPVDKEGNIVEVGFDIMNLKI